jgi:hypothetical protein
MLRLYGGTVGETTLHRIERIIDEDDWDHEGAWVKFKCAFGFKVKCVNHQATDLWWIRAD